MAVVDNIGGTNIVVAGTKNLICIICYLKFHSLLVESSLYKPVLIEHVKDCHSHRFRLSSQTVFSIHSLPSNIVSS